MSGILEQVVFSFFHEMNKMFISFKMHCFSKYMHL